MNKTFSFDFSDDEADEENENLNCINFSKTQNIYKEKMSKNNTITTMENKTEFNATRKEFLDKSPYTDAEKEELTFWIDGILAEELNNEENF